VTVSACTTASAPCTINLTTGRVGRITGYTAAPAVTYFNKLTIGGGAPADGTMVVLYFTVAGAETAASTYLVDTLGSTSPVASGSGTQGFITASPFGQLAINGTGNVTVVYNTALAQWLVISVRN
jgi:phage tail tape-measure protein